MGIIYILENKINFKRYVGQTIGKFNKRLWQHSRSRYLIGRAIRKYGISSFNFIVMQNVPNEELSYWETHYVNECNSVSPYGYNLTYGGENTKVSEETRIKHKRAHTEEHKKKVSIAMIGRSKSEETKRKMSEAKKGKPLTEDQKRRMLGIPRPHAGVARSEESRRKMSEAKKGKPWSEARRKAQTVKVA